MTWTEYFAHPGVNWSRLKCLDDSALHYRHATENDRPDTQSFQIGRYVHAQVLDPNQAAEQYAVYHGGDRRGKEWQAFKDAHPDHVIFKPSEVADMDGMIEAVRNHPAVRPYLEAPDAVTEQTVTWTDPDTGLTCKARPDLMIPSLRAVIDLKTARSVDIARFGSDIARYGYHGQLAHYAAGISAALGWTPELHILIAVEKSAPFDVGVFILDEGPMSVARAKVAELLAKLQECIESARWDGRHPEPVTLDESNLPDWIFGGSPADDITDSSEEVF